VGKSEDILLLTLPHHIASDDQIDYDQDLPSLIDRNQNQMSHLSPMIDRDRAILRGEE
jgi:hypothetical protein